MKTPAAISRLLRFTVPCGLFAKRPAITLPRVPRIGLCLSSGGARGLAHVGVIQVLEEHGIPIAAIAGSSMGAYVGALWAAGFDGGQLEGFAREIKDRRVLRGLLDPVFPPTAGLIRGARLRGHLARSLGVKTFADLRTPLLVVATDLDTRATHLFDEGLVASAAHASAAVPGVCEPVLLDGRRYTDGGTCQPLPVSLLRERFEVDAVLAVNLVPMAMDFHRSRAAAAVPSASVSAWWNPFRWLLRKVNLMAEGNVIDTFQRALMSAQMVIAARESALADVVLHPEFEATRWCDFENCDRYIAAGRAAALAALPQILGLLRGGDFSGGQNARCTWDGQNAHPTRGGQNARPTGDGREAHPTLVNNSPSFKGGGYYETAESYSTLGLIHG